MVDKNVPPNVYPFYEANNTDTETFMEEICDDLDIYIVI